MLWHSSLPDEYLVILSPRSDVIYIISVKQAANGYIWLVLNTYYVDHIMPEEKTCYVDQIMSKLLKKFKINILLSIYM